MYIIHSGGLSAALYRVVRQVICCYYSCCNHRVPPVGSSWLAPAVKSRHTEQRHDRRSVSNGSVSFSTKLQSPWALLHWVLETLAPDDTVANACIPTLIAWERFFWLLLGIHFCFPTAVKHLGWIMTELPPIPCLVPSPPPQGLGGAGGLGRRVTCYRPQAPGTAASHCCLWPHALRRQLP